MSTEIILTGSFGVGKSSMFNRFIHQEFNDKYYGTIGVRVNKREIQVDDDHSVEIKLWDVAGEVKQNKVPTSYFQSKDVILYVIDLSRPFTFRNVPDDLAYLKENVSNCHVLVVGNKKDLLSSEELDKLKNKNSTVKFDWFISAKTGENLSELFLSLAKKHLDII